MPAMGEYASREKYSQFIRFSQISLSAGLIQIGVFTLLEELFHLPFTPSYLVALIFNIIYTCMVNGHFSFHSSTNIPRALAKLTSYYLLFLPLSTWVGRALVGIGWNDYPAVSLMMIANFVVAFFSASSSSTVMQETKGHENERCVVLLGTTTLHRKS